MKTSYQNIDQATDKITTILQKLCLQIQHFWSENLIGVYLFGSLSYDAFNPDRSDLDLQIIIKQTPTKKEIKGLEKMHLDFEKKYPKWQKRIEASYTPVTLLTNILPPKEPRPYFGEGKMWSKANYGNEWLINLFLIKKYGKTLYGPDFNQLVKKIKTIDLQKANLKDFDEEWLPKLKTPNWFDNYHYQSYLVLNLCRILNLHFNQEPQSKKISAHFVKTKYPEWKNLIEEAENWSYQKKFDHKVETMAFLRFAGEILKDSPLDSHPIRS